MSDLQEISPEVARKIYLDQRRDEVSRQTLQTHRYRIDKFVEWCQENGIKSMADVSGIDLHEYRVSRREDGLKTVSLQGQLSTIRQFLRICATVEAVDENLHEKILLPSVSKGEISNDELLETPRAHDALEYLNRYHYASRQHVELLVLWRTSMRRGGIRALDLSDFDPDEPALEIRHRPDTDTPLKNREWSERDVGLRDEVAQVVQDYIDGPRVETEDEYGRVPLLTTNQGRIALGTIKQDMYCVTRPCTYGWECPHDRDPNECEAMNNDQSSKCPSSRSPHKIRTGSVTAHLDAGTPKAVLGDRVDMTEDTMDIHYDKAGKRERMMRRREYLPEEL